MRKKAALYVVLMSCCAWILTSCNQSGDKASSSSETESAKPVVYVPVPPYKYLASRLAGDAFEVRSLVLESDDPHAYSPTPKQVAKVSKAAILFTGEMGFEEDLAKKVSDGTRIKVYSLTDQVELLAGACEHDHHDHDHDHAHDDDDHDHAHDDHHHHDHGESDPHVWLSPKLLINQARQIAGVLKNATADEKESVAIEMNLQNLVADLNKLDTELAEKLAPMKGQKFYVYHGAFAYFAKAYGLEQKAIEVGSRRPEAKQITSLVEQAKKDKVKMIFVQPQFDQSSANAIAEAISGKVLPLDPLEENVIDNLRKISVAVTNQ